MEAFSFLKYWRGVGRGRGGAGDGDGVVRNGCASVRTTVTVATPIVTAVSPHVAESDGDKDGDEDGPFFDLEFTVPDEDDDDSDGKLQNEGNVEIDCLFENNDEDKDQDNEISDSIGISDDQGDLKLTLSPCLSDDHTDPINVLLSPSDDLFFKGRLVSVEPSSLVFDGSETNSKSHFRLSLLRSATKFRVLMLKLKKSKPQSNAPSEKMESCESAQVNQKPQQTQESEDRQEKQNHTHSKFFTVKVEEVPILSLFTRDGSSKSSNSNKSPTRSSEKEAASVSDEKRFSKDVMQKYLKIVKPLYIRVSKRYGEKLSSSAHECNITAGTTKVGSSAAPSTAAQESSSAAKSEPEQLETNKALQLSHVKSSQKLANLPAGLRVVCKHLGKSRSASAAPSGMVVSSRKDDSLLEQQDGIQSAILHCKRSLNASRAKASCI